MTDLQFESFFDPNFLRTNQLDDQSVLEYFYSSKFFDSNSLNQKRRRGVQVPPDADGIEYKLAHCNAAGKNALPVPVGCPWNYPNQFGIYVIQKVRRLNGLETPDRVYYVAGGTIFQAPSLGALIMHRLQGCCTALNGAMDALTNMLRWSMLTGYHWKADLDILQTLKDIAGGEESLQAPPETVQGTKEEEDDDEWTIQLDINETPKRVLSQKRILPPSKSGISVMYQPREISHAQEVLGKEYNNLFAASTRLAKIFTTEIDLRWKVDEARKGVFTKCHESLMHLQEAIYESTDESLCRGIQGRQQEFWDLKTPTETTE